MPLVHAVFYTGVCSWRSLRCLDCLRQKACTVTSPELYAAKRREMNLPIRWMTPRGITYLMVDGFGYCDSTTGSPVLGSQRLGEWQKSWRCAMVSRHGRGFWTGCL